MRVLFWISSGFLEDLARIATQHESNYDLVGIETDTEEAVRKIREESVDVVLLGKGRMCEWSRVWHEGRFDDVRRPCVMLITTLPVSTATLLEASGMGIQDVADLTMDRDEIGRRMLAMHRRAGECEAAEAPIVNDRLDGHQLLREISDETDRRILSLIAEGKFDKEISDEVFLSLQTIRNRVSRMLAETGAKNRTHLAMMFTTEFQGRFDVPADEHMDESTGQVA